MKHYRIFLQLIVLALFLSGCSKNAVNASEPQPEPEKDKRFFVIGYMFANSNLLAEANKIDFNKITHLNIAFLNPDATGVFSAPADLKALVEKAHASKVKVIAALGGGNAPEHLKDLLTANKRAQLVEGLLQLTNTYGLDGIDVDLEGEFVNENYEAFVVALSAGLKKQQKLMTAAVATWNSAAYSDKSVALFDLINIMSYDQTGPWRKEQPGPHSTYEAAVTDFNHWNKTRSVPAAKLILGLPFYAWGFGPDILESMNYGALVQTYPGAEKVDLWELPGKGIFYYNGLGTIQKKVKFSMDNKAGGVMIWQLLGDSQGDLSLLNAIHSTIKN